MTKELNKAEFWNSASIAGFGIGAVPIIHGLITKSLIGIDNSIVITLVSMILWVVKFAAGIYLTKFFMDRYRIRSGNGSYQVLSRFGMAAGVCAALIFSGFNLADMLVISPDYYEEAFNQAIASSSKLLDYNTLSAMEKTLPQIPAITFFSNLTYCSLYGVILATILARYIAARHFLNKIYNNGNPLKFTSKNGEDVDEQDNDTEDTENRQ